MTDQAKLAELLIDQLVDDLYCGTKNREQVITVPSVLDVLDALATHGLSLVYADDARSAYYTKVATNA
jgi:hypothetical protein